MKSFSSLKKAQSHHPRKFTNYTYIYPVISRRSGGVSIGVNVNLDKKCNFACPYCQVNRHSSEKLSSVSIEKLINELKDILTYFDSQGVCQLDLFSSLPDNQKVLRDIALSGDGEPTMFPSFQSLCQSLLSLQETSLLSFKLVLITNASLFHKKPVLNGIQHLLKKKGEVWAKLDAGTEEWYQKTNDSSIPFQQILDNLLIAGKEAPLTIQTLFYKIKGNAPSEEELDSYAQRLLHLKEKGATIHEIQLHTLAREPAESFCTPLSEKALEQLKQKIFKQTAININIYS